MGGLNMTLIPLHGKLGRGLNAIVDDDVAEELSKYRWHCDSHGYACRSVNFPRPRTKRELHIQMHREVLRLAGVNIPKGYEVDHINHDPLDNRMCNLRIVTPSQNRQNQSIRAGGTSRYKGVCWHKGAGKWQAQIHHNGKTIHLGAFATQPDAARAYDEGATKLFGEFAHTNQELLDTTEFIEAASEAR